MGGILVLDDEPEILETIKLYFGSDYDIYTAGDAYEGLALFLKKPPVIIVADIRMPGMSGIQFAKRVRETNKHVGLIFITGSEEGNDAEEAQRLGATAFLHKPVDMEQLREAIEGALKGVKKSLPRHSG